MIPTKCLVKNTQKPLFRRNEWAGPGSGAWQFENGNCNVDPSVYSVDQRICFMDDDVVVAMNTLFVPLASNVSSSYNTYLRVH